MVWEAFNRFVRHQMVASLTGGLYWASDSSENTRLLHLYIYLSLGLLPLSLTLYFPLPSYGPISYQTIVGDKRIAAFSIYLVLVGLLFASLKFISGFLHAVFDSTEKVEETKDEKEETKEEKEEKKEEDSRPAEAEDAIELSDLSVDLAPVSSLPRSNLGNMEDSSSSSEEEIQGIDLEKEGTLTSEGVVYSFTDENGDVQSYVIPFTSEEDRMKEISKRQEGSRRERRRRQARARQINAMQMVSWGDSSLHREPPKEEEKPKDSFVVIPLFRKRLKVKIGFDRMGLENVLDRERGLLPAILAVILAVVVGALTFLLVPLYQGPLFGILFVSATSAQFSLIKSPQPDASSPIPGHNRWTAFSRATFFILSGIIVLISNSALSTVSKGSGILLYGWFWSFEYWLELIRTISIHTTALLPVISLFGWAPQPNTLICFLCEFINIRIGGGTGSSGLKSAFWDLLKTSITWVFISLCAVAVFNSNDSVLELATGQVGLPWFSLTLALFPFAGVILSRSGSAYGVLFSSIAYLNHQLSMAQQNTGENVRARIRKLRGVSALGRATTTLAAAGTGSVASRNNTNTNMKAEEGENEKENEGNEGFGSYTRDLYYAALSRLLHSLILAFGASMLCLLFHLTTIYVGICAGKLENLNILVTVLASLTVILGFVVNIVIPQLRRGFPFGMLADPILRDPVHTEPMWDSENELPPCPDSLVYKTISWSRWIQRVILHPLLFISMIVSSTPTLIARFGPVGGAVIITICGLYAFRGSLQDETTVFYTLFTLLLVFRFEWIMYSESFLLDYFVVGNIMVILREFALKLDFVAIYSVPFNLAIGSAAHAFLFPLALPHTALLILQMIVGSVFSAPLIPISGSTLFVCSYPRAVKFWEKQYQTTRIDRSMQRLGDVLDSVGSASNLNSVFYEHLTISLAKHLASDISTGRFSPNTRAGDFFLICERQLTALVQLVQKGSGWCCFQLRGIEFAGTYCQERELEAILEDPIGMNTRTCCEHCGNNCEYHACGKCLLSGKIPKTVPLKFALQMRWQGWQVSQKMYHLESYDVMLSQASAVFEMYSYRATLVRYYVMCCIFFVSTSPNLAKWLQDPIGLAYSLDHLSSIDFIDRDSAFTAVIDMDFDRRRGGVTLNDFWAEYGDWIKKCAGERMKSLKEDEPLRSILSLFLQTSNHPCPYVRLLFAVSLLARRILAFGGTFSSDFDATSFLDRYSSVFKGDIRVTDSKDDWVVGDITVLDSVKQAVRWALKLHVDHFSDPDQYSDLDVLYKAIVDAQTKYVVCHEGDPAWMNAIISGTPRLLSLRVNTDENQMREHWLLQCVLKRLPYRVVQINRELVRGLWAGQQHELIFLGNQNPERGSIQNMRAALRNLVNQACDLPVGYPIYVSPLTVSWANPHPSDVEFVKSKWKEVSLRFRRKEKEKENVNIQQS